MTDQLDRPDPSQLLVDFLTSDRSEKAFTKLVGSVNGLVFSGAVEADEARTPEGPVQIVILAGQSNMEGHGKVEMGRTLDYDKNEQ